MENAYKMINLNFMKIAVVATFALNYKFTPGMGPEDAQKTKRAHPRRIARPTTCSSMMNIVG